MFRRVFSKSCLVACVGALSLAGCGNEGAGGSDGADPVLAQNPAKAFSESQDTPLVFSAIPDTDGSELTEKFNKVAEYLSEELGVPVRYQPSPDYGASVEAFINGDIQFAWFGGLTGVQAMHAVPGSAAIAQGDADPLYYSYFIAHADSGLPQWNGEDGQPFPMEMRGMSFTFGSPKSTSGRLMPEFFIRESTGESPAEFFGAEPAYSGSHDNTVVQVNSGAAVVGAVNYKVFTRMAAAGEAPNAYIVWKTPYYADYNLTARGDLDDTYGEGSMAKLQEVLVGMTDPQLLAAFDRDSLIPAKNSEFQGIVDVARNLGFME